jgi:di/tricarboxylate transporter
MPTSILALLPLFAQATATSPAFTTDMLVVLGIVAVALILFVSEWLPLDVTAIGLMVLVIVLEPFTSVSPQDGVSGFASTATITVLAMFILSEGVRRTGLLQRVGNWITMWTANAPLKRYSTIVGLSGASAGVINNTPVVAMMIPMVVGIAKKTKTSPSKLLMPVSFAAMMGGTLTLIGTSTNILASDVSARLIDRPFGMFEFTGLGAVVLLTGCLYLIFVGRHLIPERIKPEEDLTDEFEMAGYLSEVVLRDDSPLVGQTVDQFLNEVEEDIDIVQINREDESFPAPLLNKQFRAGDVMILRTRRDTLFHLMDTAGLQPAAKARIREEDLDIKEKGEHLVEVVILSENPMVGETIESSGFSQRYDALVLAIRRRGTNFMDRIDEIPLQGGDTLLLQASPRAMKRFSSNRTFILIQESEDPSFRREKTGLALGIVALVVGVAGLGITSILVSALAGVFMMIVTNCVQPNEIYKAVDWSVIFLLAGLIPLGIAMERSGLAEYLAYGIAEYGGDLSGLTLLFVFYVFTSLITQVISNNASVVLMIPVAVEAARLTESDPFSFVLAVTFGASCALLTPIGYQTNLMVYGPGGYRFTDFLRVGGPLQILLTIVTCLGIVFFYGV